MTLHVIFAQRKPKNGRVFPPEAMEHFFDLDLDASRDRVATLLTQWRGKSDNQNAELFSLGLGDDGDAVLLKCVRDYSQFDGSTELTAILTGIPMVLKPVTEDVESVAGTLIQDTLKLYLVAAETIDGELDIVEMFDDLDMQVGASQIYQRLIDWRAYACIKNAELLCLELGDPALRTLQEALDDPAKVDTITSFTATLSGMTLDMKELSQDGLEPIPDAL